MDLVKECITFKGENGGSKSEFKPRQEKSNSVVSKRVPHKPSCTNMEDG